jgi:hypothetical protein
VVENTLKNIEKVVENSHQIIDKKSVKVTENNHQNIQKITNKVIENSYMLQKLIHFVDNIFFCSEWIIFQVILSIPK